MKTEVSTAKSGSRKSMEHDLSLEFLRVEGIRVLAQDLLDVCPRKVHFFLDTGNLQVRPAG